MQSNVKKNNINKKEKKTISKKMTIAIVVVILIGIVASVFYASYLNNISYAISKYGSSGKEVKQIQEKLKRWGYYTGSVDGVYGTKTVDAVKKFQRKNGLTVDGIAGKKTLAKMGIFSSSNTSNSSSTNSSDAKLLSRIIYAEARGEPYEGQVAVGAVVLNRVKSSSFPNTVSGVIYQSGAFDAVSDGQINMTPDKTSMSAAKDALNGWDPSYGCTFYFNPSTATSKWIWSKTQIVKIGKHIFCKD